MFLRFFFGCDSLLPRVPSTSQSRSLPECERSITENTLIGISKRLTEEHPGQGIRLQFFVLFLAFIDPGKLFESFLNRLSVLHRSEQANKEIC